ncbi:alanine--glyoxylate aminotransferase 2, mitochondrial isoform X3 [Cryptotermes secundus]|nr:alanine--glyoxylate aminotransferase 2, mitochondrial isoform X3 [Cryptotermes secundus]XP_023711725.1 alanine--glyoxylate aminotransferase 2, mitochondrial isoform X3 [Cryptotermes secundus]XP_023711726.1 alanine--glyoxylate aminotransferase 2, mitochondrial isoform X3 [Cryptotermes secundus]
MPNFEYQPKKYLGPSYEKMQNIWATNIISAFAPHFKEPLLIHDGKMQWLFDHTGRRYLDMFGGIVTVSVGHCHPKVSEAAAQQLNTLWHTTNIYLNPKLHEYAAKLTSKLPDDLKVVYFVNSGSEANDFAVFLARLHTKNSDIISLRNAYHGMSYVTMALTAQSSWRNSLPLAPGFHHTMNPDVYQGLWGGSHCRDSPVQTTRHCDCKPDECNACDMYYGQLEEIFKYSLRAGNLAGFFTETIQGIGGVVQFPKGFLKKAYELVRTNGGVCIADEVQTGFGRTGEHFWGFEMHDVIPDIVTMAKGICNGLPMAAVVTTPALAQSLKGAYYFNTFGGNPVSCAAGLTVLNVIEEEKIQENAHVVGTHLLKKLAKLRDQFECIGDVRGKGLMIGVEMVTDKETRTPLPSNHFVDIWDDCKNMGVLIGRGGLYHNVFRMTPPMCVTREDVDFAVGVFEAAIQKHQKVFMK